MFLYHPVYLLYHLLVLILLEMYSFIPTTCLGDSQPIWWAFQKQSFCQGLHIAVHFETPVWINQLELWYIAEMKHVPHVEISQLDPIGRLYLDSLLARQKLFAVLSPNPSIRFGIFRSGFCTVAEVCAVCEVCGWMGLRRIRSIPTCRWLDIRSTCKYITCVDHSSMPCKLSNAKSATPPIWFRYFQENKPLSAQVKARDEGNLGTPCTKQQ